MTLMLVPLIGALGVGAESSSWFLVQRAAQNAADSAAMAAALAAACTPATTCKTTYVQEAAMVAARYNFVDGSANTTVATTQLPCPSDATLNCYQVTITRNLPIILTRVVGYNGDVDLDGGRGKTVAATAIASQSANPAHPCLEALDYSGGTGITTNGSGPGFSGCTVATNGTAKCNQPQGATSTIAANSNAACGGPVTTKSLTDPYAALKSNIPPVTTCGGGGGGGKGGGSTPQPISGPITLSSTPLVYCNGAKLSGDVTTTGTGVIVIYNGNLDPNGHTFQTGVGSGVTLIFTGSTNTSGMIAPNSKVGSNFGVVDIAAPTSGTWSGMAVYTNPDQTASVQYNANGTTATVLKITGGVYMPHAQMTFNGSFNKATNSPNTCLALVVDTFVGNGALEKQTDCSAAGLTPPSVGAVQREALVQ
jgi:hypothetical protein